MNDQWVQALGKMTYGIYVLTSFYKENINGMIASWVSQVSYDPLLIMVAVHSNRYSHNLIEQSGFFALHILAKEQSAFIKQFKGPDPKLKFSSLQWTRGITGCPVLNECIAYFECNVKTKYTPGNHTLFLGEVLEAKVLTDVDPLCTADYEGIYLGKT